jgi:hypothetical protein
VRLRSLSFSEILIWLIIIGTNVALPEPRTDVELSHSRKALD